MRHIKLFENFEVPKEFEVLTEERYEEIYEYFEFHDKAEAEQIRDRIKGGETMWLHETYVDDDYEGFDGSDDYFDSEGHSWDVVEFITKNQDCDIVAEADNSEGTYYTIIAKNNS